MGVERSDRQHQPIADTQSRIHHICHRPAVSRASKTHVSGLGPPWRSHPCIEGYPQCHRVRAVGMERSDRQHQPIADTQSRFTVYVTGLLPEPPKRMFGVWGSHGGPILVLGATHSATGCVPWAWSDQDVDDDHWATRGADQWSPPGPALPGLPERGVHTKWSHHMYMDVCHAVFCIGLVIMTHNTPWLLSTSFPITNLTTHPHPPLGVGATYGLFEQGAGVFASSPRIQPPSTNHLT